ncbi:MAG TPA: metal-sensitive transcriptional regulator [Bacillota bacterium]|nr:metal-sensitive transcriptional regulator [Bacillota bacterium]HNU80000.1 metal-sensitive transcriptional regulator [Bacillota bacterium]HPA54166.1 metal-sensitive transcriptional regulator [Bacillota bacterium]HPX69235.1 metal-sensitive transcriptional regulator [Bacillota bacterium]HQA65470.1 metal-sensitive transcriptional regulator [Bacillota bacterium]
MSSKGGIPLDCNCDHNVTVRTEKEKKDIISRLNRIEGQVRGIKGMIEKDVYCDDVLNQISSVNSAMNSVGKLILKNHMKSCLIKRIQAGELDVVDELLYTIEKMLK